LQRNTLQDKFGVALGLVKRAMSEGIIGCRDGRAVPYSHSEECEKRVYALSRCPIRVSPGERYVCSWWHLRRCLACLLNEYGAVEVARLKTAFRARFRAELSETALGCTTLTELLRHEQVRGVVKVDKNGNPAYLVGVRDEDPSQKPEPQTFAVYGQQDAPTGPQKIHLTEELLGCTKTRAKQQTMAEARSASVSTTSASEDVTSPKSQEEWTSNAPSTGSSVEVSPARTSRETSPDHSQDSPAKSADTGRAARGWPGPTPLPPWCAVRKTFIDVPQARCLPPAAQRAVSCPAT